MRSTNSYDNDSCFESGVDIITTIFADLFSTILKSPLTPVVFVTVIDSTSTKEHKG